MQISSASYRTLLASLFDSSILGLLKMNTNVLKTSCSVGLCNEYDVHVCGNIFEKVGRGSLTVGVLGLCPEC